MKEILFGCGMVEAEIRLHREGSIVRPRAGPAIVPQNPEISLMSADNPFQDLIRRVRAGDEDAATQLVRRYEAHIRRAVRTALAGCSINGSWQLVTMDPPGVPFPLDIVTFDEDHGYTATHTQKGEPITTTGRYQWNGRNRLEIAQEGRQPLTYRAKRRFDGTLVLTFQEGDNKVTATLAKVDDQQQ